MGNYGGYIVVGIIAAVVIGIIAYYLARFLKGKLTLDLPVNTVESKQPLSGTLNVHAKKNIDGLLIVSLVGQMEQRSRSSRKKSSSTEWVDVYRKDMVLEEERNFPMGFIQQYQFNFTAPTSAEVRSGSEMMRAMADKVGGAVGGMLNLAAGAVGMMQGRIYWFVEARLDAKGVDLYTKKKIRVNLRNDSSEQAMRD